MLKSILKVHRSIDILKYGKLTSYLKSSSRNYKPKRAEILKREQIEELRTEKSTGSGILQVKVGSSRC